MALHLPIGSLKTRSGLETVPRYEPRPLAGDLTTAPSGPVPRVVWAGQVRVFNVHIQN